MAKNRYKLGGQVHQGPSSSVYMARQVGLGRDVVLKVFHCDNEQAMRRFRREVASLARLRHPNNVQILDTGSAMFGGQPRPLLVMEYIRGETLRSVLEREMQLSPYRAWRIGIQVLSALAEAHAEGIVHRDIKPENLMVWEPPGLPELVKVIDYGLAEKVGLTTTRVSQSEQGIAGTPHYMAPELANGGRPTGASDVYAVAVVLYELLAGRRPFDGHEGVAVLYQQVHEAPEALENMVPLPPVFAEIIAKGMAKDTDGRYVDAREFLMALRRVSPAELREYELVEVDPADSVVGGDTAQSGTSWDIALGFADEDPRAAPTASRRANETPSVWFLTEDPAMKDPEVLQAISGCSVDFEVETLDAGQRAERLEAVRNGTAALPWVVVFGDLHVMLEEPLLSEFGGTGAVSRLLISTHLNAEMLQATVNYCGLDQQIDLPLEHGEIIETIHRMVERTKALHHSDDRLRLALRSAHHRVRKLGERLEIPPAARTSASR